MTDWELETIGDFDGAFFDDGTGWKVLFQIHMGISIRAQITNHPVRLTTFNRQLNGIVWTEDIDGLGTKSLPGKLRELYSAIESLVGSSENIRWTESSGRSPEWTIESLTEDIGMGEFEPLIRPQKPEPFVWLIAALERLRYPKIKYPLGLQNLAIDPGDPVFGVPSRLYRKLGFGEVISSALPNEGFGYNYSWSSMTYQANDFFRPNANLGYALRWNIQRGFNFIQSTARTKLKWVSLVSKTSSGTVVMPSSYFRFRPKIKDIDYICNMSNINYTGPDWVVRIGSSDEVNVGTGWAQHIIEGDANDLDFAGTKSVSIELVTGIPSSVPFNVSLFPRDAYINMAVTHSWIYFDLPENMAVGELSAPESSVSASAEQ